MPMPSHAILYNSCNLISANYHLTLHAYRDLPVSVLPPTPQPHRLDGCRKSAGQVMHPAVAVVQQRVPLVRQPYPGP